MPIGPDSNTVRCRLENLGQPVALIVDDETSAHDALSLILQSDGFAIDQARTGREALDRVRATLPAVVLLDLNLPDIGGIDLIPDIRSMSPDSRIVVVTGFATTTATVLAIKRGAVDILEKPVFAEELLSSVHAAMNFVADSPAPAQHPNRRLKDPRVKKVVSLVEQHLGDRPHLSLGGLAETVGVSPTYLSRLFKREMDIPLTAFIRQRRILAAAELIRNSRDPLARIAHALGYSHESDFSRDFQKVLHCSPRQYRCRTR